MRNLLATFCLVFLLSCSTTFAEDWNQFRGPHTDGTSSASSLPTNWSEEKSIVWKTPMFGDGWSSPVASNGKIWVTTSSDAGQKLFVVCIDAAKGHVLKKILLFENVTTREPHKTNNLASSTPYIEDDRIYVHFGSYGTACLNTETFEIIWHRRDLPCHHWRGPGSSPIIYKNLMIVHFDGYDFQYVVALDKMTGKTVWKTTRSDHYETDNGDHRKAYATPLVINVGGKDQLISPCAKMTFSYEPETGKELWFIKYPAHSTAVRPIFENGMLYITSGFTRAKELMAVDPTGSGNVTESHVKWKVSKGSPSKPSFIYHDEMLYMADDTGVAQCVDAKKGTVVWKKRLGGNFSASPVLGDGKIYFFNEDGKTFVIKPGNKFEQVAVNELTDGSKCSFAVVDNDLIIRTVTHLYRISE